MAALLCTVLLLFPSVVVSQQQWEFNGDAEKRFAIALKNFNVGEFAEAASGFEYLTKLPPHHRTTAAYVMLGKAYYRIKDFRESVKALKHFIDTYPHSLFIDDAHYTLGLNYEAQYRYDDALVQFLAAMETTHDSRLRRNAFYYCEKISNEKLTIPVLTDILSILYLPESEDYVRIKLAEKHSVSGNLGMAEQILEPVTRRSQPTAQYPRAESLLQEIRTGANVRIGLLLPLMNKTTQKPLKTFGEEFLMGMQFALEEQRASHKSLVDIALEVRDTERDPSLAARQTQELIDDRNVLAIVGPIFNNEALACASIANAKQVPLVTPTANADGLAAIGSYVVQLSPDMSTRGKAAAHYAVTVLGLTTLAVVAPNEGNGKIMASAFAQEASRLGARLVATEWYPPQETDLREQLRKLRRAALNEAEPLIYFGGSIQQTDIMRMVEHGAHPSTIDSLLERAETISVYDLFGPDGKLIADSLHLQTFIPEGKIDSLELPATGIQAIYMPINNQQEIAILSSQLAYYNIVTRMLGSSEWYNTLELDANRRYTDGVVFLSDFYVDSRDPSYINFSKRWFEKTKRKLTTNAVLGYDAMRLISSVILSGTSSREALAQALASIENVPLFHGTVTLTHNRVNNTLHVLQFKAGEVKKIGAVNVQ